MSKRRVMAGLGIAALALLASACSSNNSPANNSTTTTTTTTTTTSIAPSNSTTTGAGIPTTTTTTAATVALCTGSAVGVTGTMAGGAAGHQGVILLFVNHGATSCVLFGYPGVAGLDASGAQVVQAQRTLTGMMGGLAPGDSTLPRLTVPPGQTASAVVEGTDVPSGNETNCPTYASLLVTPPNTKVSVTIPLSLPGCSGLQVHPVVAGTTGSTQF